MATLVLSTLAISLVSIFLLARRRADWRRGAPLLLTLSLPLLLWSVAFSIEAAPQHAERIIGHSIQQPITRSLGPGATATGPWDDEEWFPFFRNASLVCVIAGVICSLVNLTRGVGKPLAGWALAVAIGWLLLVLYGIAMAGAPSA